MHRTFDKILVPMDLSTTSILALDHALYLAKEFKSELHLLHVKETPTVNNFIHSIFRKKLKETEIDTEFVSARFQEYINDFQSKHGVTTIGKFLEGTVYIQVLNYAKQISAGLICMGTHGSKGVDNFIGGSNTFRVVNQAKCPVLSVHANSGTKGIKDIVLPLDSSRDTREKVDDAIYIAKQFNSTIHVVGVSTSGNDMILNRLRMVAKQVENYIKEDKIATTFGFKTGKNLASISLEYAKEKEADLIIIMTEQESSAGFLAGPYSQQMINESDVPILSVRPKDRETEFVTPY
jgi:nucleotide-binding universal stress UspA family protein